MAGKGAAKLIENLGDNMRESIGKGPGSAAGRVPPLREKPREQVGVQQVDDAFKIEIERIMPDPDQPRKTFLPEDTREMADSLLKNGQITPIRARFSKTDDRWVIVAGERRYQGALLAGLKFLRVVRDETTDTTDRRRVQLAENLHRRDLPPKETALAFRELMDLNSWSTTQLAEEMQIAQPRVVQALALLRQPEEVQALVEAGQLKPATAYEISKVDDRAEQVRLAQDVVERGLSRDDTRVAVKESAARVEERAAREPALAEPRPAKPGRKVGGAKAKAPVSWKTKIDGFSILIEKKRGFDPDAVVGALRAAADAYEAKFAEPIPI